MQIGNKGSAYKEEEDAKEHAHNEWPRHVIVVSYVLDPSLGEYGLKLLLDLIDFNAKVCSC